MCEVAIQIKVMPESPDVDLEELKRKVERVVPATARLYSFDIQPIAFGLKALLVTVLVGDEEGGTELLEAAISNIEGVESVQVVTATRMI